MTALLKKDFYLIGKQLWWMLIVALALSFIPQLSSFGNTYLLIMTLSLTFTTLAYDERCHWDAYLAMMPCRPAKVVLSKYLFMFILACGALVLTSALTLANAAIAGAAFDLEEKTVERITLLLLILTANAVTLPVIFRFGVEKGRLTMTAMMFSVFAVIVGGAQIIGADKMFGWLDRIPLYVLCAAAAAIIILLNLASFFLSVRFYRKRQGGS